MLLLSIQVCLGEVSDIIVARLPQERRLGLPETGSLLRGDSDHLRDIPKVLDQNFLELMN